jgi:cellulose synthase/poly-beta-1,6-N-acetylglucosamine synthase-like glycosyltransferase/peptidoglycan/xylan/chitin deacetylase (PgdA/CDA1 family)/spore germination protein YaaH
MSEKPVFYDPQRKRWKRFRRVIDLTAVGASIIFVLFVVRVLQTHPLKELLLPTQKFNYRAVAEVNPKKLHRAPHRKTDKKPSEIQLNSGEGVRAAYYVDWDAASYSSLKQHISQIDILFPEWLHVVSPDGNLVSYTIDNRPFAVVDRNGVHNVDHEDKVIKTITNAKVDTEIFPLVNNYDPVKGMFLPSVGDFLNSTDARANFIHQVDVFLAQNPRYHGLSIDFEEIPTAAQPGFKALLQALYADFHNRHLRLYINAPVGDNDYDLKFMAANSDGLLMMNYDAHSAESGPGAIAPQKWFVDNLKLILKDVPKEKLICAIGSYGYDWTTPLPPVRDPRHPNRKIKFDPNKVLSANNVSTQEAWQEASDSEAQISLDPKSLNPHFAYDDNDAHVRHQVWMLDAVTVMNEMRAARDLGIQTFALWRLGSEDQSLWKIWDKPQAADPDNDLNLIPPGADVDTEGDGDILRVIKRPQAGQRTVEMDDADIFAVDETMVKYPLSYTLQQYGYSPKRVAITFDDGPDPTWTPRILDVLKKYNVKATFLLIGETAENNVELMRRIYREGHEIGNHTFTHPDISEISNRQMEVQLNLTERLFAAKLGVEPIYFRPPYSIDQEPDTNDQAEPVDRVQQMGYIILGNKIDTDDWDEHPRKTPQEITDSVFAQIAAMKDKPWMRGSIILMHDGGGNRQPTVDALPVLITALRAHGYQIVPVCELLGKTRNDTMPPLTTRQRWQAHVDSLAFSGLAFFNHFVIAVFYVGDILMSLRLILIGLFAVIDRFRKRKNFAGPDYLPSVAVLIPAYNEEKVIVRTIRSVMMSTYKNIRVIVIDDGSKDATAEVARAAYPDEIASGRLLVLTKPNAGKAEALNYALDYFDDDIYVGIDADTVIAHDAIARLVPHFANPAIGAVAGNAKVGNRVNLWTRWQALEYITSQNFERRALDLFDVVMVVPGAIGAWRTSLVKAAGGYAADTVAEDADLTMNLLEQGYSVIYEDQALAFTEAPINADGLKRQRFRWSFGMLQAIFKHRGAIARHRAMGLFALPNILIFQILLPLVSPFIDLFFLAGVVQYFVDRHFHPEAASAASLYKLLTFFLAFLLIDFATSALAFSLERKHPASKGDAWLLAHIWLQRFTYRQVFSIVLFKTLKRAIDGKPFSWDKLERTAHMSASTDNITRGS